MTKAVRVENADNSGYQLVVQIWDKGQKLSEDSAEPDILVSEHPLNYPTAMAEVFVHSTRYLVVKEKEV